MSFGVTAKNAGYNAGGGDGNVTGVCGMTVVVIGGTFTGPI